MAPNQSIGRKLVEKKIILLLAFAATLVPLQAQPGCFRVHYSVHGSRRNIIVQADLSSEARRAVMDMFPGALVTGVSRIKR